MFRKRLPMVPTGMKKRAVGEACKSSKKRGAQQAM